MTAAEKLRGAFHAAETDRTRAPLVAGIVGQHADGTWYARLRIDHVTTALGAFPTKEGADHAMLGALRDRGHRRIARIDSTPAPAGVAG